MGSGFSQFLPCFNPAAAAEQPELIFTPTEPLDETLGHSFRYVRSSARFLSPTHSDRFISPSQSLRFSPRSRQPPDTGFKAISGASVSANTSTPRTVLQFENIYDDATDSVGAGVGGGVKSSIVNGFQSTSSFSALPLQPLPRGGGGGGDVGTERAFVMSGPIERGALSGPLDSHIASDSTNSNANRVPFSAPLNTAMYVQKKRKKAIPRIRKAFNRNFPPPWVVPVVGSRKENQNQNPTRRGRERHELDVKTESDVQWALGKAGEDRVHVVVSEEHGWLFVGIYDGFNGPDAPEFLMGNLYKATYKELQGLFWDSEESSVVTQQEEEVSKAVVALDSNIGGSIKKVTFESGGGTETRRKRLWEYLAQEEPEDGIDLSGSERFAFSMDDAVNISNTSSGVSRRSLLISKLRNGFTKHKEGSWRFGLGAKEQKEVENRLVETSNAFRTGRMKKVGPVDHDMVLRAMSRALEVTELAYLGMTDKVMDQYPELALMGSCLLVALMRDEDVYVMNLGDSRAIVAQHEQEPQLVVGSSGTVEDNGPSVDGIVESKDDIEKGNDNVPAHDMRLMALQLSTDHSTSIEEEVTRIKNEHPDDNQCIVNGRVKGRLKVTRAFGAGFLKQPKWNDSLLEMFRNEYIGTAPYVSCEPSLRHHHLCPRDQFIVLSSDGLYQYFSNQEVVSHVASFMEKFPEGDPAQHLIEELLLRAAKKAGMDLHELLDIPQGDRRKYHDDVTVMVVSLEGRIWKSSGKYM